MTLLGGRPASWEEGAGGIVILEEGLCSPHHAKANAMTPFESQVTLRSLVRAEIYPYKNYEAFCAMTTFDAGLPFDFKLGGARSI